MSLFLLALFLSVRERLRLKNRLLSGVEDLPVEPKSSYFTVAMGELLAIAGGIYLTLLVTVTFLAIEIPSRISIGLISFEPLAAISLLIAIIQPWVLRILLKH